MKISAIIIQNIRGFQNVSKTDLSKTINVFVGPNNSGKSTILNCIFMLQRNVLTNHDITIGQSEGKIELFFQGSHLNYIPDGRNLNRLVYQFQRQSGMSSFFGEKDGQLRGGLNQIPEQEPYNLIYPYLSKRKTVNYTSVINENNANSVTGNFANLYSKIDRLITPQFILGNRQYIEACNNVLGFEVSTIASGDGKKAVYYVHELENIPLTSMGEGVANIIGLISDLCVAKDKIFLIEEPENDVHPKALKSLLKLIIEKSSTNQFFVSTHSNIVMKYLGSALDSRFFI
jgi:AAA15 family ATPase/GTPase